MVPHNKPLVLILFACLLLASKSIFAMQLFRYKNEQGTLVINNHIPAKYAASGYEIIDKNARIIKTVLPQLTTEEYRIKASKNAEQEKLLRAKKKKDNYDLSLLKRFSFTSDIKAEQRRKADELNVRVTILKSNLRSVRTEVDTEYGKAAQKERNSTKISQQVKDHIKQLEKQILSTESLLQKHEHDIFELNKEYERAIRRFKELIALKSQRHI